MLRWTDFARAAPAIAEPLGARLAATGLAILGTVRVDGSPRVSPVEVMFVGDGLYVGMMPGSAKLHDAERDPRCALLTPVADRHEVGGEGKLFGALGRVAQHDADTILATAFAGTDVDPAVLAGSPVLEVTIRGAAWQFVDGETWVTRSWTTGGAVRVRHRVGPTGTPVDVPE